MVKQEDFKPLYKAEYSSMGALINTVLPEEVKLILGFIKLLEMRYKEAIEWTLGWLCANFPPYKKYMKDYDELRVILEECRVLTEHWKNQNKRDFPTTLKEKLYYLYERWWEAYNDSGAGIRGHKFVPQSQRIKEAIQRI